MCAGHLLGNAPQTGIAADARGAVHQATVTVHRARAYVIVRCFMHGHRFAGKHGFIDIALAVEHYAIHRQPLTGAHANMVIQRYIVHRDFLFNAVAYHPGGFLLQVEQPFKGAAGATAGFELQCIAQQNQADHHGRGFKIDAVSHLRQPGGKEHHHHGVEPGGAGTHGHQGVHVGLVVLELFPGVGEKVPPRKGQNSQRQQANHQPIQAAGAHGVRVIDEHAQHEWNGEGERQHAALEALAVGNGLLRLASALGFTYIHNRFGAIACLSNGGH